MDQPFQVGDRLIDVAPLHPALGERRDVAADFDLRIDGERVAAELVVLGGGRFEIRIEGRSRGLWLAVKGDRAFVHAEGRHFEVTRVDALARIRQATLASRGGAALMAPMPGVVVEIRVAVGSPVEAGETVLVIESMKLQTAIVADVGGTVAEIAFEVGQSFDQGVALARIEAASEGEDQSEGGEAR